MRAFAIFIAAACLAVFGLFAVRGATAQPASPQVAVWVEIPRPAGTTDQQLTDEFNRAVPRYAQVPGLERKHFTYSDAGFGGVYLWTNRAAASAFFNVAWHDRVLSTYGSPARLVWFDVPRTTPGASRLGPGPGNVVSIVRVRAPWYATDGMIGRRFDEAVPTYAAIPTLIFKAFTIGADRTFGGVYLWNDAEAATAFFDAGWHDRIKKTYGRDGEVIVLQAPVTLINATR